MKTIKTSIGLIIYVCDKSVKGGYKKGEIMCADFSKVEDKNSGKAERKLYEVSSGR